MWRDGAEACGGSGDSGGDHDTGVFDDLFDGIGERDDDDEGGEDGEARQGNEWGSDRGDEEEGNGEEEEAEEGVDAEDDVQQLTGSGGDGGGGALTREAKRGTERGLADDDGADSEAGDVAGGNDGADRHGLCGSRGDFGALIAIIVVLVLVLVVLVPVVVLAPWSLPLSSSLSSPLLLLLSFPATVPETSIDGRSRGESFGMSGLSRRVAVIARSSGFLAPLLPSPPPSSYAR